MQRINVSEFKAVCLSLLEKIRQTGEPVEILKNGKPLVVVYPPVKQSRQKSFGLLKDTLKGNLSDLTEPLSNQNWEVLEK